MSPTSSQQTIEQFSRVAKIPHAWQQFVAGIGAWSAPSRLIAARECRGAASVIDLGCGPCVFAETLERCWAQAKLDNVLSTPPPEPLYLGIDGSEEMLLEAKRRNPARRVLLKDVCADDLPTYAARALDQRAWIEGAGEDAKLRADVVVMRHVLEHLQDPLPALCNALVLARRKVVLVFSQVPLLELSYSVRTDDYLGCTRWAHQEANLLAEVESHGWRRVTAFYNRMIFGVTVASPTEPNVRLAPNESLWILEPAAQK